VKDIKANQQEDGLLFDNKQARNMEEEVNEEVKMEVPLISPIDGGTNVDNNLAKETTVQDPTTPLGDTLEQHGSKFNAGPEPTENKNNSSDTATSISEALDPEDRTLHPTPGISTESGGSSGSDLIDGGSDSDSSSSSGASYDEGGEYTLRGEVYIHGIMYGEAFRDGKGDDIVFKKVMIY